MYQNQFMQYNNYMPDMGDESGSMGGGINMGGMPYMNDYGEEVTPTNPSSQVTPQMMQNQFYPPEI
jgi:hypothetical protein